MKTRWRFWLLPLLTVGLLLSVFEVNTNDIVNTWGDTYDAYLLPSFSADSSPSATVSPRQRIRSLPLKIRQFSAPSDVVAPHTFISNCFVFLRKIRIYLRCCQWLI